MASHRDYVRKIANVQPVVKYQMALKRKLWGFCLASSILVVWAILPLVFACVRRSEWES
jgi:hypothetical protein